MEIGAALADEELPQLRGVLEGFPLGVRLAGFLRLHAAHLHHRRALVVGEEVGHLTAVEQVVDVLDVRLLLDLRVAEEEHHGFALPAGDAAKLLEVLLPLHLCVRLADGNLKTLHAHDERREARQGLSPRTTDADAQHVRAGLFEDAADARDVLRGVKEHGQVHRRFTHAVEIDEILLQPRDDSRHVRHLVVQSIAALRIGFVLAHEIAEHAVAKFLGVHLAVAVGVEMHEELVEVLRKVRLGQLLDVREDPVAIFVVHQSVVEDAHRLVHPQAVVFAHAAEPGLDALRFLQGETLDDAGDVAEVEGVVRLRRRGEQLGDGLVVHV